MSQRAGACRHLSRRSAQKHPVQENAKALKGPKHSPKPAALIRNQMMSRLRGRFKRLPDLSNSATAQPNVQQNQ